jgi:hypothetical protein
LEIGNDWRRQKIQQEFEMIGGGRKSSKELEMIGGDRKSSREFEIENDWTRQKVP